MEPHHQLAVSSPTRFSLFLLEVGEVMVTRLAVIQLSTHARAGSLLLATRSLALQPHDTNSSIQRFPISDGITIRYLRGVTPQDLRKLTQ